MWGSKMPTKLRRFTFTCDDGIYDRILKASLKTSYETGSPTSMSDIMNALCDRYLPKEDPFLSKKQKSRPKAA